MPVQGRSRAVALAGRRTVVFFAACRRRFAMDMMADGPDIGGTARVGPEGDTASAEPMVHGQAWSK
jgi:hypothetical protein